jgi:CRISPR-associated protein Cas1
MALTAKELALMKDQSLEEIRPALFGLEGSVSAMYWAIIYEILNEYSDFTKREKQGAKDLVNNMLNYGYGILYSRIWLVLMKAGLNPWMGYLHSTERDAPALVFDFIEQFRQQAVDRVVIAMITKGEKITIEEGRLSDETRKKLATKILERLHRDEEFRGKQMRFSEIMQKQARHLEEFLSGKARTYKPYVAKW